jgi:hypothetical protein
MILEANKRNIDNIENDSNENLENVNNDLNNIRSEELLLKKQIDEMKNEINKYILFLKQVEKEIYNRKSEYIKTNKIVKNLEQNKLELEDQIRVLKLNREKLQNDESDNSNTEVFSQNNILTEKRNEMKLLQDKKIKVEEACKVSNNDSSNVSEIFGNIFESNSDSELDFQNNLDSEKNVNNVCVLYKKKLDSQIQKINSEITSLMKVNQRKNVKPINGNNENISENSKENNNKNTSQKNQKSFNEKMIQKNKYIKQIADSIREKDFEIKKLKNEVSVIKKNKERIVNEAAKRLLHINKKLDRF